MEQQQCRALQQEREEARAGQLSEHRKLEALQVALEEERQAWTQQEHQLKEHLQALREESQAQLEREKVEWPSLEGLGNGNVRWEQLLTRMRRQNLEATGEQGWRRMNLCVEVGS